MMAQGKRKPGQSPVGDGIRWVWNGLGHVGEALISPVMAPVTTGSKPVRPTGGHATMFKPFATGGNRPSRPSRPRPKPVPGRPAGTSQYGTHVPAGTRPDGGGTRRPSGGSSGGTRGGSSGGNRGGSSSGTRGGSSSGNRVVRRPSKPQTYKGPNGEIRQYIGGGVRQGSGTRGGATGRGKAEKDPLEKLVDEIIASRIAPIQDARRQLREQSVADVIQQQRLGTTYDQKLDALRADAQLDHGAALAQAARLRGHSEEDIAAYQEWSKNLLAPTHGGTGDATVAETGDQIKSASDASFDAMGAEIASRGQDMNDWTSKQQVAGQALTGELVNQERLRRAAAEREFASEIAQQKGQRAEMLYQMQQAEREAALKEQAAAQAFGLDMAKLQQQTAYQNGQLALGAARLEQQAQGAQGGKPKVEYGQYKKYGIPKVYDKAISGVYSRVLKDKRDGKLPEPWRNTFSMLTDSGLGAGFAARLASDWWKDSITRSTPLKIRQMFANRGVPVGIQKEIITRFFGPRGWAGSGSAQASVQNGTTGIDILDSFNRG